MLGKERDMENVVPRWWAWKRKDERDKLRLWLLKMDSRFHLSASSSNSIGLHSAFHGSGTDSLTDSSTVSLLDADCRVHLSRSTNYVRIPFAFQSQISSNPKNHFPTDPKTQYSTVLCHDASDCTAVHTVLRIPKCVPCHMRDSHESPFIVLLGPFIPAPSPEPSQ